MAHAIFRRRLSEMCFKRAVKGGYGFIATVVSNVRNPKVVGGQQFRSFDQFHFCDVFLGTFIKYFCKLPFKGGNTQTTQLGKFNNGEISVSIIFHCIPKFSCILSEHSRKKIQMRTGILSFADE